MGYDYMCVDCNLFFEIDHPVKHFDEPIPEVVEMLKCECCGKKLVRAYINPPTVTKWSGMTGEQRADMLKKRATQDFEKNVKEIKIEQEKKAVSNFEKKMGN